MRNKNKSLPKCPNCAKNDSVSKIIDGVFEVFYCRLCKNGFTHPVPAKVDKYYPKYYWKNNTLLEEVKKFVFQLFQERRVMAVEKLLKTGKVLDVGAGEGKYFSSLPKKYELVSQEPKYSKVKNPKIIKRDFLAWNKKDKYDVICFWESLEHTPNPQKYLEKAHSLLKPNGKIIVEYPRYDCWESKIFGKYWFHLDTPRHLAHLTNKGIKKILARAGFSKIKTKSVFSIDYTPWGFMASLFNIVGIDVTNYFKKTGNMFLFLFTTPLVLLFSIIEMFFYLLNQSPVSIVTAEMIKK